MDFKIVTKSESDTIEIAENLESEKFEGMVICLNGELGSGKTVFVKAFANALGIKETVTSPTFNLIKEYDGELPLYHMDVYRLNEDVESTGLTDYFNKSGVCIIEWAETISDKLPNERLDVYFKVIDENTRILVFKPYGTAYEDLCSSVL